MMQMGQNSLCTSETLFSVIVRLIIQLELAISAESRKLLYVGEGGRNYSESTYASSGDQLTIVKLDALEIVTRL